MTDQQIQNTLAFLGRVQLSAQEIPAFLDAIEAVKALKNADPEPSVYPSE